MWCQASGSRSVARGPGSYVTPNQQPERLTTSGGFGIPNRCSFQKGVAMTIESIRECIRREPFEPIVLRLSNGEALEILHPECVAITKSKVVST